MEKMIVTEEKEIVESEGELVEEPKEEEKMV